MEVGMRVNRLENREITGATILDIDGDSILIAYDEGGQGWWPAECLQLISE